LLVFLCLAARLATLWGRVTTFLKERLISGGECEILPAIAARNLLVSGHKSPLGGIVQPNSQSFERILLKKISFLVRNRRFACCRSPR
jgi:hypothetical protein